MQNKKILIALLLVSILVISACSSGKSSYSKEVLDKLTKCVTENNVVMYGSITCSVCAKQKRLLWDSFENINEIECHPKGPNPQTELCLRKDIEKTPTWIVEIDGKEVKRTTGFLDEKELAEFAGCDIEGI